MSISLLRVFSPLTVEPNKPNCDTPTDIRGTFSEERRFNTDFLFISQIFTAKIKKVSETYHLLPRFLYLFVFNCLQRFNACSVQCAPHVQSSGAAFKSCEAAVLSPTSYESGKAERKAAELRSRALKRGSFSDKLRKRQSRASRAAQLRSRFKIATMCPYQIWYARVPIS